MTLRDNNIDGDGIKQILNILSRNESILSLDLRNNPGFTKKNSLVVLEKLKKNLERFRLNTVVKKNALQNSENIGKVPSRSPSPQQRGEEWCDAIEDKANENSNPKQNKLGEKNSNSFANDVVSRCGNCESLKHKVLRLEFENNKLRMRLSDIIAKHPATFNSCNLSILNNKPIRQ